MEFDLEFYLNVQRDWSKRTFGAGRQEGICKHIEKELAEVRADPMDLMEWVDIIILALDGAWRTGASADDIARALALKQSINLGRKWGPITGDDQPIEHVRECNEEQCDHNCPVCPRGPECDYYKGLKF
jgi:hypothetical protein